MMSAMAPVDSSGRRVPIALFVLGMVAALVGWFLLGSAIGVGVLHGQRCGDRPELSADPTCRGAAPAAGRGKVGAGLLLIGVTAIGAAAALGLVRGLLRDDDPAA
jgi:uncharacterized membrane protein